LGCTFIYQDVKEQLLSLVVVVFHAADQLVLCSLGVIETAVFAIGHRGRASKVRILQDFA
jgi:hypothetical protein